jgi:myo-inositol-1-phosphate synthase
MRIRTITLFVLVFLAAFSTAWLSTLPRPWINLRWMLPKDIKSSPTQVNQKAETINKQMNEIEERMKTLAKTARECSDRIAELERLNSTIQGAPVRNLQELHAKNWEAILHYGKLEQDTMHLYDTLSSELIELRRQRDAVPAQ